MKAWIFNKNTNSIDLVAQHKYEKEVKCIHSLASHSFSHLNHVVAGDFDGNITLWNSEVRIIFLNNVNIFYICGFILYFTIIYF